MQDALPLKQTEPWNNKLTGVPAYMYICKRSLLPTIIAEFASTPRKRNYMNHCNELHKLKHIYVTMIKD